MRQSKIKMCRTTIHRFIFVHQPLATFATFEHKNVRPTEIYVELTNPDTTTATTTKMKTKTKTKQTLPSQTESYDVHPHRRS